jgi:hypothetical protein
MSDPSNVIAFVGLVLVGAIVFGYAVADAVRDSDWWVIARGVASGKRARFVRFVRGVRRG